jgi:hypothetical protein
MVVRLAAATLLCTPLLAFVACGGEQAATPPPLIPEATSPSANQPATRPVPATRSLESRTIGAEAYSPAGQPTTGARTTGAPGQAPPNAWSPTPVNGVMNPSPPAGTPVYGEMNPSPPGR